jgi:hypothetical protein
MKRLILIAACALFAFAACTKTEKPGDTKLSAPRNKNYHASFTLNDTKFDLPVKNGGIPKTIDITSGGKFLLGFMDTDAIKPEESPLIYKSGKYDVRETKVPSADLKFTFDMYGSLIIKQDNGDGSWLVEYIDPDGSTYSGAAIFTNDKISGVLADNICRSWKPTAFIMSISGGDLTTAIVGKKFSADINEVVKYLKDKGVKIDVNYAKYSLESIDFMESGMILVNFKDFAISPFVGNFSLKESQDNNIAYNFVLSWEDNPVIPVSGNGSVHVDETQLTLYTESDTVISGKEYHISVSIFCDEIK